METITLNLAGPVRRVSRGGQSYLVAPLTLIVPGVLPGSRGALFYPARNVKDSAGDWDGVPIVVNHPQDPISGQHLSAADDGVWKRQGVGHLENSRFVRGKLVAEGWFAADKTGQVDNRVLSALQNGDRMEVSTGLHLDTEPAPRGASFNGRPYEFVATNYRPDHLAILPDQVGACSLQDGCGLMVNQRKCSACGKACNCQATNAQGESCPKCGAGTALDDNGYCANCGSRWTENDLERDEGGQFVGGTPSTPMASGGKGKGKEVKPEHAVAAGSADAVSRVQAANATQPRHTASGQYRPHLPSSSTEDVHESARLGHGFQPGHRDREIDEDPEDYLPEEEDDHYPATAFNAFSEEDHPRDEKGRFGGGEGGADRSKVAEKMHNSPSAAKNAVIGENVPWHNIDRKEFDDRVAALGKLDKATLMKMDTRMEKNQADKNRQWFKPDWAKTSDKVAHVAVQDALEKYHGKKYGASTDAALKDLGVPAGTSTHNREWTTRKRDELEPKDFAGPHQTFPIADQDDVDSAAKLIGKASDSEAVKRRIIEIAGRKNLKVPDAWQKGGNMASNLAVNKEFASEDERKAAFAAMAESGDAASKEATRASYTAQQRDNASSHEKAASANKAAAAKHAKSGNHEMAYHHTLIAGHHAQAARESTHNASTNDDSDGDMNYKPSKPPKLDVKTGGSNSDDADDVIATKGKKAQRDKEDKEQEFDHGNEEGFEKKYGFQEDFEKNSRCKLTANEWLASAPPEIQSTVRYAMSIEKKERDGLVARLVANVQGRQREALQKRLAGKPLDELYDLLALAPRTAEPVVNYLGAAGADLTANVSHDEDNYLPLPAMNYSEK